MDDVKLVRNYLEATTPGRIDFDRTRKYLFDDVSVIDPLMSVDGADAFVEQLRKVSETPGGEAMRTVVEAVVGADGVVAALTRFEAGDIRVTFTQWFWVADGKIRRVEVVYDPRSFLAAPSGE